MSRFFCAHRFSQRNASWVCFRASSRAKTSLKSRTGSQSVADVGDGIESGSDAGCPCFGASSGWAASRPGAGNVLSAWTSSRRATNSWRMACNSRNIACCVSLSLGVAFCCVSAGMLSGSPHKRISSDRSITRTPSPRTPHDSRPEAIALCIVERALPYSLAAWPIVCCMVKRSVALRCCVPQQSAVDDEGVQATSQNHLL